MSQVLEILAGVSNAERHGFGSHFDDNTIDKRWVTTLPRILDNGSEKCDVQIETASDSKLENSHRQQMRTDAKGKQEQEVLRRRTDELLIEQATQPERASKRGC